MAPKTLPKICSQPSALTFSSPGLGPGRLSENLPLGEVEIYDAKEKKDKEKKENNDSSLEMTLREHNVRASILKSIPRLLGDGVATPHSN